MIKSLFVVASLLVSTSLNVYAEISLQSTFSNLSEPVFYYDPNDGSGRTFIVEKQGVIKVVKNGSVLPTPLLNISSKVSSSGEQGLLSMAFDPRYKSNRRYFVFYTGRNGALTISSFTASSSDRDRTQARSERVRLRISHSENTNHNGGQIAFGPDNLLYIGTGDGGGANDPNGNGQKRSVLLGKILRIDVSGSSGYSIPSDNPFRGVRGAKGEIYAYGLRNPWRFSFDKKSKALFVGDVGQGSEEEVDIVKKKANLGWNIMEGNQCFNPSSGCNQRGLTKPIATYGRSEGQSITGGYVYRGKIPSLKGKYIFGDFASGNIWTLTQNSQTRRWLRELIFSTDHAISSFGQDRSGEVYVVDFYGEILKIVDN